MTAQIIVHPRAFPSWVELLRLAVRLDRELVSSRRGHILLVPRTTPPGAVGFFTRPRSLLPPEAETALIALRPTFGETCGQIPMEGA